MHGLLKAGLLLAPALARGVGATASPQGKTKTNEDEMLVIDPLWDYDEKRLEEFAS